MNLNLDLRYLNKKYLENTTLLKEGFETLYGEHSELGRWMRSKNIIENVDGILFIHGGISPFVNNLDLSIDEINTLARPYYADTTYDYPPVIDSLFNSSGPFWYRGYYSGSRKATMQQIAPVAAPHTTSGVAMAMATAGAVILNGPGGVVSMVKL